MSEPTDTQVEALARVLYDAAPFEGVLDIQGRWGRWPWDAAAVRDERDRCRAMARAALAALGSRELALEAALRALLEDVCAGPPLDPESVKRKDAAMDATEAALSLPPSAAAEAVRGLVKAARIGRRGLQTWIEEADCGCDWDAHSCGLPARKRDLAAIDAALQPFGEGEA